MLDDYFDRIRNWTCCGSVEIVLTSIDCDFPEDCIHAHVSPSNALCLSQLSPQQLNMTHTQTTIARIVNAVCLCTAVSFLIEVVGRKAKTFDSNAICFSEFPAEICCIPRRKHHMTVWCALHAFFETVF